MHNPSDWHIATVTSIVNETPDVKTITFTFVDPVRHLAGQHYEIRLTAEDGYQAARLYSAASAADGSNKLQLTIALVDDGEVTPYLFSNIKPGDRLELRGPLGKFFVWQPENTDPVLLLGGGSGVVPLRCILQAHASAESTAPIQLIYGVRSYDDIIYKKELLAPHSPALITIAGEHPAAWQGNTGLINDSLVREALNTLSSASTPPLCYVCGSTPFVELATGLLAAADIPPMHIKAERFGPAAR
ncbi:MAG TPA: FAD-binding oxidoreductase [Candidatus Saccharimonadales bacterium]|nr:FAD-binding oxidoreductase [Candidatus Saccharimonadales bacterium]